MKLVRIEPGSFTMGQDGPAADHHVKKHAAQFDDADWDETPANRVTISTTEVTCAQYRQFKPVKGADADAVNLHCQSLHEAGVVSWRPGEDRRSDNYFVLAQFRREPGRLDYRWCRFWIS
ncbi:MAG: hypothetical protein ABMA13_16865 [Chthoniobacteraceae bacterium]